VQLSPRLVRWSPVLDGLVLVVFVAAGRENHDITGGALWALKVIAPLAVGFAVMGLATRLYASPARMWLRLAITIPGAVLIGGALRWIFRGMPAVSVFTVVATGFFFVAMFGWRAIALAVTRRSARASA